MIDFDPDERDPGALPEGSAIIVLLFVSVPFFVGMGLMALIEWGCR